jgi:hypothetical protein
VARISRKQAECLRKIDSTSETSLEEAKQLEAKAMKLKLEAIKQCDLNAILEDTDEGYDALICGYFR